MGVALEIAGQKQEILVENHADPSIPREKDGAAPSWWLSKAHRFCVRIFQHANHPWQIGYSDCPAFLVDLEGGGWCVSALDQKSTHA
jgi:hypothetical protein